jgi:hypothetical protein
MDTKYYIEKPKKIQKWVLEYQDVVQAKFDTKTEAKEWGRKHFPGHGHESERVQVRENSPKGAKKGQWM